MGTIEVVGYMDLSFLKNFQAFEHVIVTKNGTKRESDNPAVNNYANFSQNLPNIKKLDKMIIRLSMMLRFRPRRKLRIRCA